MPVNLNSKLATALILLPSFAFGANAIIKSESSNPATIKLTAVDQFALGIPDASLSVKPRQVFMNLEDGMLASVFNKPGFNWSNCTQDKEQQNKCEPVAWPDNHPDSVYILADKITIDTMDPYSGKMTATEYYPIEVTYKRDGIKQKKRGWIEADYISMTKTQSMYADNSADLRKEKSESGKKQFSTKTPKKTSCPCEKSLPEKNRDQLHDIAKTISASEVEVVSAQVSKYVGKCAINPGKGIPADKGMNSYDKNAKALIPEPEPILYKKGNFDQHVKRDDLISIDALARTLYGEMGACFKKGPQYPMAVALVAVNRAKKNADEFIRGPHDSKQKSDLAKVVTSPSQFNVWMNTGANPSPLAQALCPPAEKGSLIYNGTMPSNEQLGFWNLAVKISTEAVLFSDHLKKRAPGFDWKYYTSSIGRNASFSEVRNQKISGRALEKPECVRLWKEQ